MMDKPTHRPLYEVLRERLIARLIAGELKPGAMLPSETALAAEAGVSTGTARKAIDSLVAEGLLRRHQGKGTFVAEETPERASFRFFRLVDAAGARVVPEPAGETVLIVPAGAEIAARLGIAARDAVVLIERVRAVGGRRAILETVAVPAALMPGLAEESPLPNALYPHYQSRHGVSVVATEDWLTAAAADSAAARALGIPEDTPLLVAERLARDLAGRTVEWRRSRFLTDGLAYRVTLG